MVDLLKDQGYAVGPKRIRRLFRLMGYQAIYRKKNLTKGALKAFIRPYLLRGLRMSTFETFRLYETNVMIPFPPALDLPVHRLTASFNNTSATTQKSSWEELAVCNPPYFWSGC